MLEGLPAGPCWKRGDAETMLRIEALGGDDTLFLATHSPIRGFGLGGTSRQDLYEPSEDALLATLSRADRQHAFCVVQGDPGSGKSHLIRWLEVKWPQSSDLVLLLQRADGSLQGALEQLKTRVITDWPEFAPLFEPLDRRQKASIAGRADVFQATLAAMMKPEYSDQEKPLAAWCAQHDLSRFIQSLHVREGWTSPRRILELMDGKADARDSKSARFNLEDIIALARVCGAVNDSVPSERFARKIQAEAALIEDWLAQGDSLEDIRLSRASQLTASLPLIEALNGRLNEAVQSVIGVSGESLVLLFRKLRQALKGRARVVLLLEDITAWQGLDNSLIDALVLDARTRDDVCPLISVVGVTPEYYDDLQKNYVDRITHEVRLGQMGADASETVTLREAEDRQAFSARYLNATRAGETRLAAWREVLDLNPASRPPNPCLECPARPACHSAFGAVDEMGLYPFGPRALERLFHALKPDDKGQTHRTPRGLLQNVLGPTLRNPAMLQRREYPGYDIETEKLDERARALPGPMRALVESRKLDPAVAERLRRTLVYWGEPNRLVTQLDEDGALRFGGVSQAVFTTFDLPWLGGETDDADPIRPLDTATPPSEPTPPHPEPPASETSTSTTPPPPPAPTPGPPPPTPAVRAAPRAAPASRTKLQRLQSEVIEARSSGKIGDAGLWNEVIYEIVKGLDPRAFGLDRRSWSLLFTPNTVQLEGSAQTRTYSFVLPRQPWLYDGLEAYCALRSSGRDEGSDEYHRRRLAFMLRQVGRLTTAHAQRRLPPLPDGAPWDLAATAAQVLLARAWLKGTVSPNASTADQWTAILSEEPDSASDPKSRTEPWQDALRNTDQQHDKIRALLREMVTLPQGGSLEFGLAAVGSAALGIVRLQRRMSFLPISETPAGAAWMDDRDLRFTAVKMRDYIALIPQLEQRRLQERASELGAQLRDEGIRGRAERLNAAITTVLPLIRELPADRERRWREEWDRLSALLERPEAIAAVQGLIVAFESPDDIPSAPAERLDWQVRQPAADLRSVLDFMKAAESLAQDLVTRAQAYEKAAAAGADLSALQATGVALQTALTAGRKAWSGGVA